MKIWISLGIIGLFVLVSSSFVTGFEKKSKTFINPLYENNQSNNERIKRTEMMELIQNSSLTCPRHPEKPMLSHSTGTKSVQIQIQ